MKPHISVVVLATFFLLLICATSTSAQQYYGQSEPCYVCPPSSCPTDFEMSVDTYGERVSNRFAHGVHMAVTSPKHIPRSLFCGDSTVDIPILSNVAGAVLGPLRTVRDATVGVFEIATFPLTFFGTNERNGGPLCQECYCLPSPAYRGEDEDF